MGARFTSSEAALAPVLRETAKRGLIYVDDGSSPRSLASQIAGANDLAFAKADMTLDHVPTPGDVDRALVRLEIGRTRARRGGRHGVGGAGLDRAHRALGQGGGWPRHPADPDHRRRRQGEVELKQRV